MHLQSGLENPEHGWLGETWLWDLCGACPPLTQLPLILEGLEIADNGCVNTSPYNWMASLSRSDLIIQMTISKPLLYKYLNSSVS